MWSPGEPFFGPILKIERADKHIRELHRQILAFVALRPYRVVAEQYSNDPTMLLWVLKIVKDINTTRFPVIIGDAIHNLRSALDLAMCAIVRKQGHGVAGVYFPSASDVNGFEKAMHEGLEKKVGANVAAILRADIQPYEGGKTPSLYRLCKLDNIDKHRLLTPVAHNIRVYTLNRPGEERKGQFSRPISGAYQDNTPIILTPTLVGKRRFKVNDELEAFFEVAFDQGSPFEHCDVVAILRSLSKDVSSVLNALLPFVV